MQNFKQICFKTHLRQSLIKKNSRLREALISPLPFLEINMTSILASCMGSGIVWPVWIPRCMGSRLSWNNNKASWKFLKSFWIGINCPLIQKKISETLEDCIVGFYPIPMRTFEFSIKFIHEAKPEVVCMSTPSPLRWS